MTAPLADFPPGEDSPTHYHSHSYDSGVLEKLLFKVAKKWVAGNNRSDAIASARNSNSRGLNAILNFLGEDTTSLGIVNQTLHEYLSLTEAINREKIRGCISVKPTQLGLAIGYDLCLKNSRTLAEKTMDLGQFFWLDMESAKYTEDTVKLYSDLVKDYSGTVGVAIQSYLRRSQTDLEYLIERRGIVRLVKGAYHEQDDLAYTSRADVDAAYSLLMKKLFESEARFAIATHDTKLIEQAIELAAKPGTLNERLEFQMLMGIRDDLKPGLVERGFRISEYIPYGSQWLPYSVRRLRERKRNILLLARSLM